MPNNLIYPGVKQMSFKDYMSNDNTYEPFSIESKFYEEPKLTLNSIRTDRARRSDLSGFTLQPKEGVTDQPDLSKYSLVPNESEGTSTTVPVKTEAQPQADQLSSIIDLISGKGSTKETGTLEKFGKPIFGNIPSDLFSVMAGSLAEAIAPDTAQGRAGGAISKIMSPILHARLQRESEAPERDLNKRLTEARIKNLTKADTPKTAISWYLQSHPEATDKDVAEFKKSLSPDKGKNYWRTVSDDGTVTIYEGGKEVFKSSPGVGKTKDERLYPTTEGYLPASKAKGKMKPATPKTSTPVSWTTATKSLSARFGKQDATGNYVITPELQHSHRIAQKKLVELKKKGFEPLDAVNKSEDYARRIEENFYKYIERFQQGVGIDGKPISSDEAQEMIKKTQKAFKKKYNYVPRISSEFE